MSKTLIPLFLLVASASVCAQATQPAAAPQAREGRETRDTRETSDTRDTRETPWPGLVRQFADALATGQKATSRELLGAAKVRRFDSTDDEAPDRLQARAASSTRVAVHGYFHPALSMAADLAADLKAATAVPEEIRKRLIPGDDDQMKRANATAVQWTADVLRVSNDQPVGIIVLWCEDPGIPGLASPPELVFILLRGEQSGKDQFRISQVVYGDPLARK